MQSYTYDSYFLLWFTLRQQDILELTALALTHARIPWIPAGILTQAHSTTFKPFSPSAVKKRAIGAALSNQLEGS